MYEGERDREREKIEKRERGGGVGRKEGRKGGRKFTQLQSVKKKMTEPCLKRSTHLLLRTSSNQLYYYNMDNKDP